MQLRKPSQVTRRSLVQKARGGEQEGEGETTISPLSEYSLAYGFPEVPERHLNAARQKLLRDIFAAQLLRVLSPALNLSKNSCVFPCVDKPIGKKTIPKITRNDQKFPLATDSD